MDIALIASKQDLAGRTMHATLRRDFGFFETEENFDGEKVCRHEELPVKLYLIDSPLIIAEDIDAKVEEDVVVFLSKHRSGSDTKSFAVHSIGNWDKAGTGGRERTLCPAAPQLVGSIFAEMCSREGEKPGYEITMEATHHGPHTKKPAVFVEVGSTDAEWSDESNASFLISCVLDGIKKVGGKKTALGLGGPHYCRTFNKLSQRQGIAFGHICPKHHLDKLDEKLVRQAIENSGTPDMVILDWKGLGPEKQRLVELLDTLDVAYERSDKLLKNKTE